MALEEVLVQLNGAEAAARAENSVILFVLSLHGGDYTVLAGRREEKSGIIGRIQPSSWSREERQLGLADLKRATTVKAEENTILKYSASGCRSWSWHPDSAVNLQADSIHSSHANKTY